MRNLVKMLVSSALLATQTVSAVPSFTVAPVQALAQIGGTNAQVVLNLTTPQALEVHSNRPQPDFDNEVLAPLQAAQVAKAQAEAQAKLAAKVAKKTASAVKQTVAAQPVYASDLGGAFAALRNCEAGGNYTRNSGNGYFGAYQFDIGTWGSYGGYARADLAPPAVQDAKAQAIEAARGWSPWPACARKLGLM